MEREWVTKESLLTWIKGQLSRLEDCGSCDNPAKDELLFFNRLHGVEGTGSNWTDNAPFHLCYHQCRQSREQVIAEAKERFNIRWG